MRFWRSALVSFLLLVTACGYFSCEAPIERERRELMEAAESTETVLYRGVKVSLRSVPVDADQAPRDASATKIRELTIRMLSKMSGQNAPDTAEAELSAADYVLLAKEFYALRKELRDADEDDYPTLLEQLVATSATKSDAVVVQTMTWYNPAWEHLVLALLLAGSQKAPQGFVIYELGQLDPAQLQAAEVRIFSRLVRSLAFLNYGWPYLADEELSAYLIDLQQNKAKILAFSRAFDATPVQWDDEQVFAQWHASGVLLRGVARLQKGSDFEDPMLDDFDSFVTDADTMGLDDEGVWLISAYVGLKREDKQRAVTNLRKLAASDMFAQDEQRLFEEAADAAENRDPEAALKRVNDKVLILKIVGAYALRVLAKVNWREQLAASEAGRGVLRAETAIGDEIAKIEGGFSKDELNELGRKVGDSARKVGAEAKERAADAWHKAVSE